MPQGVGVRLPLPAPQQNGISSFSYTIFLFNAKLHSTQKMNVTEQKIDNLNSIVKINISADDYSTQYENSLKKAQKQMSLPGFREGKVPTSLVKKKHGPSILAEEVNRLISNALQSHIAENKLDVLGNPLPKEDEQKDIDWANPKDMEFIYEIGLAPEVKVSVDGKLKLKYDKIKVDNKIIDKQADDFGRRYGKLSLQINQLREI